METGRIVHRVRTCLPACPLVSASITSFSELRRDGMAVERRTMLHPTDEPEAAYVQDVLADRTGPVVASTDYMRAVADQIRPWVRGTYRVLGTDGFGRSDTRDELRSFFEVDRHHVAVAALSALMADGEVEPAVAADAIDRYGVDADADAPWLR